VSTETLAIVALLLLGLVLVLVGCASGLPALRAQWNAANRLALPELEVIERGHETDVEAAIRDTAKGTTERALRLHLVKERWAPVYRAWRVYAAVLATTRVALESAEVSETPDVDGIIVLLADLSNAHKRLEEAMP